MTSSWIDRLAWNPKVKIAPATKFATTDRRTVAGRPWAVGQRRFAAAARGDEWSGPATLVGRTISGSQSSSRKRLKGASVKISARNKLVGTVTSITRGEAIANVVVDVAGQRLIASITVEAVDELGLQEGMSVTAIVKASDVIIATDT